ncbi:MAG: DUF4112 domain-containing protein [Pseudomonadota bacterium]
MPSTSLHAVERQAALQRYEGWAKSLDSKFRIFGIPVGWDSILGLVPGLGDTITLVPALLMINTGYRAGIRKRALGRMIWNTGLDLTLGTVPLVGDLFDLAFKSHRKNVDVLRTEFDRLASDQTSHVTA